MTATHFMASTLLVAIDISKHRHEVLIGCEEEAFVGQWMRRNSVACKELSEEEF